MMLERVAGFLSVGQSPAPADLIFVLAGRPERKEFGMELYRRGLASRLILSIARFETRKLASVGLEQLDLPKLALSLPASQRHFFVELSAIDTKVTVTGGSGTGTFPELLMLAKYLQKTPPRSMLVVSTSIHLRRVRFCCRQIDFFQSMDIRYLAVPEEKSSLRMRHWYCHRSSIKYVASEYTKLAGYFVRYGNRREHT